MLRVFRNLTLNLTQLLRMASCHNILKEDQRKQTKSTISLNSLIYQNLMATPYDKWVTAKTFANNFLELPKLLRKPKNIFSIQHMYVPEMWRTFWLRHFDGDFTNLNTYFWYSSKLPKWIRDHHHSSNVQFTKYLTFISEPVLTWKINQDIR